MTKPSSTPSPTTPTTSAPQPGTTGTTSPQPQPDPVKLPIGPRNQPDGSTPTPPQPT